MATEEAIYEDSSIRITRTRAMIGASTFAIAQITSVSAATMPASLAGVCLLVGLGIPLTAIGILVVPVGYAGVNVTGNYTILISAIVLCLIGLTLIGSAIVSGFRFKPSYAVRLAMASGERDILQSSDAEYIGKVVAAMNEAIVRRGQV